MARFDEIFKNPSIEVMLALAPDDFEKFVQYVFECAGYAVAYVAQQAYPQGPGVDLNLHAGTMTGKVVARVEVRRYTPPHQVSLREVAAFIGLVNVGGDVPGFMVTTSDFTPPGYAAAKATNGRVQLINGEHLLRYIGYVNGSRVTGAEAPKIQGVQRIPPTYLFEADTVDRGDPKRTALLTVANNKGGVAKTTTAANLGLALASAYHKRVLLIDMDAQTSLTHLLPPQGAQPPALIPDESGTLADVFARQLKLAQVIRKTRFEGVWMVPGDRGLKFLDKGGGSHPQDELLFARSIHDSQVLAPDGKPFDIVIIDTPPAQTYYTRLAMAATHFVLLPATAENLGVYGALEALETAAAMHALMGSGAELLGGVITRWKKSAESDKAVRSLTDLLRDYHTTLLQTRIPEDAKIEKAHGKTIGGFLIDLLHLGPKASPAATAYGALAKEVLNHVQRA